MADTIIEHNNASAPSRAGNGVLTAITVAVLILLILFALMKIFGTRSVSGGGSTSAPTTQNSSGSTGGGSGSTGSVSGSGSVQYTK